LILKKIVNSSHQQVVWQQKKETQEIGKQIDRYTIINKIETPAQANLLSVVISVKFAQKNR
jgi:hypothetical protein